MANGNTSRSIRAFTLAEMVIALGILAVGLSLVAALFPAAIMHNKVSADAAIGSLLTHNGLALATVRAGAAQVAADALEVIADETHTLVLPAAAQHYPHDGTGDKFGFILLGRKVGDGQGQQLVLVAYRKRLSGIVTAENTACTVGAGAVSITGATNLRIGSPLIDAATGGYARIVAVNDARTEGELDHPISQTDTVSSAFVIVESGCGTFSPAVATLTTRTTLPK